MTCIVALKNGEGVFLAGDRRGSNGYTYTRWGAKVFKVGKFAFGYTTSFRMGQLLQYHWNPPKLKEDQDIAQYLYVDVLNSIKKLFSDDRFDQKGNEGGTFIMAYSGMVFTIQEDYGMNEVLDYASVGCGSDEAEAVLYALDKIASPLGSEERITLAIEAANARKVGVSKELDIIKVN